MVTVTTFAEEQQLIRSIVGGKPHLFHNLIHPYERLIYALAWSSLRDAARAEETVNEVFVNAFRNLGECPLGIGFCAWLVSIALHKTRNPSHEGRGL